MIVLLHSLFPEAFPPISDVVLLIICLGFAVYILLRDRAMRKQ